MTPIRPLVTSLVGALLASVSLLASPVQAQSAAPTPLSAPVPHAAYLDRLPQDETVYFMMVDRFANGDPSNDRAHTPGGPMQNGFDPTRQNFYLGGDLKGVEQKLDYIQHLGATAIWLSPIFRNKWVEGTGEHASSGNHGYWILDFTAVDPHFGTRAEFKHLVDAAHGLGMKVYMDIVVNHTADVIKYKECARPLNCPYRSEADYPYTRKGGVNGPAINPGFTGVDGPANQTAENFARLTRPDYAYTPYLPAGTEHLKTPDWLNDIRLYHNRGNLDATVEGTTAGDFSGLDDIMTENPKVVQGFIKIFQQWIADFHIDGYRIDTERHVNPEFWQAFTPAMLDFAHAQGIPNFHMWGEVFDPDPAVLARHTRVDAIPAVLDVAFQSAAEKVISGKAGPNVLEKLFFADPDYAGGAAGAMRLPTFLGNHDMGRLAYLLKKDQPTLTRDELTRRVILGHALMSFSRGFPVVYYGDEQGLAGKGGDSWSRQTLFASQVPNYRDEQPLGEAQAGGDHFDEANPIYHAVQDMLALRNAHPALRRGEQQVRLAETKPGLYAFTRTLAADGQYLIVLNTGLTPRISQVSVDADLVRWTSLHGACPALISAPGSLQVQVPALDYVVCSSR
ncbi:MAG: alpha-amylase family glycosyl hydrolase [Caulobacteraceae bacterium]